MGGYDRSWRRCMRGLRIVGCLLLVLVCHPAVADEDDAAARRFAREELLRVAAEQVAPDDPSVGGIEELRTATQAARKRLVKLLADERRTPLQADEEPETIRDPLRRMDALIGLTEDAPGGPTEGLIRQGARLYRYVIGGLLDPERGDEIVPPEAPAEDVPAGKDGEEKDGGEDDGDEKDKSEDAEAEKEEQPPAAPVYDRKKMPQFFLAFPDGRDRVDLLPIPPSSEERDDFAKQRPTLAEDLRDATLEITWRKVAASGGPPVDVIMLQGVEELISAAGVTPDSSAPRWVLVHPNELAWRWSAHQVKWRRWQVSVRRQMFQQEEPKGLVNDAQVEQKKLRAEGFAVDVALLSKFRDDVLDAFDHMRQAERYWLDEADRLELKSEEIGQQCDNCSPDELSTFRARQDLAKLRGTLVQQELRLLYITALRAGQRLAFLEESLKLAGEEAQLAKTVHQRFVDARNRSRRGRQLASLQLQRGDLRTSIKMARAKAEGAEADSRWGALATELERLAGINEELQSLVQTRRRLEQSAAPPLAGTSADEPAPAQDAAGKDQAAVVDTELPATLQSPRDYFIDQSFVRDARKHLADGRFDKVLVAEHHAVVDDVVEDLQDAMTGVADLDNRQAKISAAFEAAHAGIGLPGPDRRAKWPTGALYQRANREGKNLKRMEATFDVTMRGIRDQQERIRERIDVLRGYRDQLESLGVRSFGIRTDRTLSFEGLQVAGEDSRRALGDAGSWLGLEGDNHAGHFLQRNWQALALLLLAIVASFLIVRLARAGIDRLLQRMVARMSHMPDESVAIGTEAAEVREQRAAAEAARKQAEKAALAEASGEAERKRAVSGSSEGEAE